MLAVLVRKGEGRSEARLQEVSYHLPAFRWWRVARGRGAAGPQALRPRATLQCRLSEDRQAQHLDHVPSRAAARRRIALVATIEDSDGGPCSEVLCHVSVTVSSPNVHCAARWSRRAPAGGLRSADRWSGAAGPWRGSATPRHERPRAQGDVMWLPEVPMGHGLTSPPGSARPFHRPGEHLLTIARTRGNSVKFTGEEPAAGGEVHR